jgi:hypothetical protein
MNQELIYQYCIDSIFYKRPLKIIARNGKEVYSGSLKDLTQINQRKIDSVPNSIIDGQ